MIKQKVRHKWVGEIMECSRKNEINRENYEWKVDESSIKNKQSETCC